MRVILDCDPGIDDTYAIIFLTAAAHAGLIELDCVTTTSGNVPADQCAQNAGWILGLCGLPIIPLAAGLPAPLEVELTTTPETHGDTGLGYATAPERHVEHDWDALWIDSIERGTDDLHLIVTGPLTNLAAFAHTHPEHFAKLKHITVMGGAVNYPGNTTPTAEWNTWVDPDAAKEVFAAVEGLPEDRLPIVCALETTERIEYTPALLDGLLADAGASPVGWSADRPRVAGPDAATGSPVLDVLADALRFYFEFHHDYDQGYIAHLHDLFAAQVALGTAQIRTQATVVDVEADSDLLRGTTVHDDRHIWGRRPNARRVVDADPAGVFAAFAQAASAAARAGDDAGR